MEFQEGKTCYWFDCLSRQVKVGKMESIFDGRRKVLRNRFGEVEHFSTEKTRETDGEAIQDAKDWQQAEAQKILDLVFEVPEE